MEHSEWPCLSVQMIQDAFVWAKQIFRLTDHLTEMGDINNVLVISKCIPAVPAILRLKAVSRKIFPDRIMKASRIGVRTIFVSPLPIQGNQKLAEKNPKYYGIIILKERRRKKEAPHVQL